MADPNNNLSLINILAIQEEAEKKAYNPDKKPPDLRRAEIHGVRFDGYAEG
jgi:hypothetical protein